MAAILLLGDELEVPRFVRRALGSFGVP